MEIEIPDETFDDGVVYNTTTPDNYEIPIPEDLFPDEDIGVTREKELLH